MLKPLLALVALALVGLLVYAAMRPDHFALQRSLLIQAPAPKVYALISDLKGFNTWNPFAAQDPAIQIHYEAVTAGPGAAYRWQGEKSGAGRMEVAEAVAPQKVVMKLDFTKPMEGHNTVEFTLRPQGDAVEVTWAMQGPMPYLNRLVTIFFDMDKMVGGEFEKGLASLKTLAEKS